MLLLTTKDLFRLVLKIIFQIASSMDSSLQINIIINISLAFREEMKNSEIIRLREKFFAIIKHTISIRIFLSMGIDIQSLKLMIL